MKDGTYLLTAGRDGKKGLDVKAKTLQAVRDHPDTLRARHHYRSVKRPRSILLKAKKFLERHPLYRYVK